METATAGLLKRLHVGGGHTLHHHNGHVTKVDLRALEADLASQFQGEVRFDRLMCPSYIVTREDGNSQHRLRLVAIWRRGRRLT